MPHRNLFPRKQRLTLFLLSAVFGIGLTFVWALSVQEPSYAQVRKVVERVTKASAAQI